jgi:hypothetical protein
LSLRTDDLDSVGEPYTEDELRQLVVAVEAPPAPLGGLGEAASGLNKGQAIEYEEVSNRGKTSAENLKVQC